MWKPLHGEVASLCRGILSMEGVAFFLSLSVELPAGRRGGSRGPENLAGQKACEIFVLIQPAASRKANS